MGVYVYESPEGIDLSLALGELSPARREYALKYRNEIDRKLSAAVYILLKRALRVEFGIDEFPVLAVGPNGKPYLPEHPEIHFNLSHCPQAAACAVGVCPVGIDVEAIAPVDRAVAERVLSSAELRTLDASPRPEVDFARYWTMKEALVKLRGTPPDDAQFPGLLESAGSVRFETKVCAGYVLSIATSFYSCGDEML